MRTVGADEGFLRDVGYQIDVAHHAADQAFDAALVLDDQHLERLDVAALDAFDQRGVGVGGGHSRGRAGWRYSRC